VDGPGRGNDLCTWLGSYGRRGCTLPIACWPAIPTLHGASVRVHVTNVGGEQTTLGECLLARAGRQGRCEPVGSRKRIPHRLDPQVASPRVAPGGRCDAVDLGECRTAAVGGPRAWTAARSRVRPAYWRTLCFAVTGVGPDQRPGASETRTKPTLPTESLDAASSRPIRKECSSGPAYVGSRFSRAIIRRQRSCRQHGLVTGVLSAR
jgi:hypothetical protein